MDQSDQVAVLVRDNGGTVVGVLSALDGQCRLSRVVHAVPGGQATFVGGDATG
jgi:hypothetical protein